MPRKAPPIVIRRGKLLPKQRAPLIQTQVVLDRRFKVRKAKHKKAPGE